jgi:hypothetical protein
LVLIFNGRLWESNGDELMAARDRRRRYLWHRSLTLPLLGNEMVVSTRG